MADKKISQLADLTTPADNDLLTAVDLSDTSMSPTGTNKRFSWANIKAALKTYFDALYITTGTVVDYAGSSAPTGWLLCNGATVSQTTYAALFAVTGHTYGADPGGGNFILPDCRGRVSVAKSTDTEFDVLGETGGEKTHLLTSGESGLPAHTHQTKVTGGAGAYYTPTYVASTSETLSGMYVYANTAANASSAHNNIQPYIVFNKIIKT